VRNLFPQILLTSEELITLMPFASKKDATWRIEYCEITSELEDIVLKASEAGGGGILGVDAMEGPEGLVVHEVNSNVEFRGASQVSNVDIAVKIVDYLVQEAKR